MRRINLLFVLLLTVLQPAFADVSPKDSLLTVLSHTTDTKERIRLYRDLADISVDTPVVFGYLHRLYELAKEEGDIQHMMEALTDLTSAYFYVQKLDSARYYVALSEQVVPEDQHDRWCSYLSMRLFNVELGGENVNEAIEAKIAEIQQRDIANESPYKQIEAEYTLGVALLEKEQYTDAIPHLIKALDIAKHLPQEETVRYQIRIIRDLSKAYNFSKQSEKSIAVVKQAIELQEKDYNQFIKPQRPFYPINDFYIIHYSSLLSNSLWLPDPEVQLYLGRLKKLSEQATSPSQKYDCFRGLYNYSVSSRNFKQAVIYNDSVIYYVKHIAPYNLPNLYRISSQLFNLMDRHKEALNYLSESYRLKDSLQQNDMQDKLSQLQVEYGLNQLNYEKTQLEIRNKRFIVIGLLILLALVFVVCLYLYMSLRRERRMKEQMQILKLQAEESEKLKSAFINSICHEIRTPLNGIVGFAELMLDPTLEDELKSTFPIEIQQNTDQLVTLINSMLEVSNLDVSDEALTCTATDISRLCQVDFERYSRHNHPNITSSAELPEEPLTIATHERYLSLVIEQLLDNAYKFTEQGHVRLRCERLGQKAIISVEDTGCGIPPEKREIVFERFTKLDTYKPGSGLGLYLCQLIIKRLSGRIFIDPQYTGGTRIVVELNIK